MTARTPQRQQLIELIGPVITAAGYDLDGLSVTAAGRRSLIRVSVDGDHGIDLDAVATISRAISDVLDDDSGSGAAFAGPYVLEVSSPGVDRPLTEPRHWRRSVGRLVTVAVAEEQLTGRIVSAENGEVVLEIAGQQRSLPMTGLGPGRVQVEFSRPGEPEPLDDADESADESAEDESAEDESAEDESEDDESADDESDDDLDGFEEDPALEEDAALENYSQNHKEEA
jgi:ribosome maturation factor RimP